MIKINYNARALYIYRKYTFEIKYKSIFSKNCKFDGEPIQFIIDFSAVLNARVSQFSPKQTK